MKGEGGRVERRISHLNNDPVADEVRDAVKPLLVGLLHRGSSP